MKAKCYKNMSAGAQFSPARRQKVMLWAKRLQPVGAAEGCDLFEGSTKFDADRLQWLAIPIVIIDANLLGLDDQMREVVLADHLAGQFMPIVACRCSGQGLIEDEGRCLGVRQQFAVAQR